MRHENIGGRHHNRAGKDFGHKSGDALQEMQEKNLMNENCFNKRKRTTTDQKAYQAECTCSYGAYHSDITEESYYKQQTNIPR